MAEEEQDVAAAEAAGTPSPDEAKQPEPQETAPQEPDEPVDEAGVPLRNREAEARRKARKAEDARRELLSPKARETESEQDEAIRIVERIAEEKVMKRLEPILARQFLAENPDAADMVEDINRVRQQYPELASIDRLDAAYKIARAERQDELIRKQVESEQAEREATREKASQAAAEGTGRTRAAADTLDQRISTASMKDLEEIERMLKQR